MVYLCNKPFTNDEKYLKVFNTYPFPLSDFQKYAIYAIHEGHNVLITAHTGSGKTLPAEEAIKKFVSEGKKVIYTSPIKALSNQKYHDFTKQFPNISFGILTGDVKNNRDADVLIMTTEILRNTLFQMKTQEHVVPLFNIDIQNDLACVIFDEVHYINDKDRGTVWEETLLMLPNHIQLVLLSATLDKPEKFASWIESHKKKQIYLATTETRVVPLIHYGFIACSNNTLKSIENIKERDTHSNITNKLIVLNDNETKFNEINYYKLHKALSYARQGTSSKFVLNQLISELDKTNKLPAICFVFSRKNVERYAKQISHSLLDGETQQIVKRECEHILRKLPNYMEYIHLSEYRAMLSLLEKGIAIHHSGILPILREMVELLFEKGIVKLLFATETFAVGINMPTKTVIFTDINKFDGTSMRQLKSFEYTQMAGRAGRRGLDTIGYVIHCNNMFDLPIKSDYHKLLNNIPQSFTSKFKIAYNLILNLISIKNDNITTFIEKSMIRDEIKNELNIFTCDISGINADLETAEQNYKTSTCIDISLTEQYIALEKSMDFATNKKRKKLLRELSKLRDNNQSICHEVDKLKEINSLKLKLEHKLINKKYVEEYIQININIILDLLEEYKFISKIDDCHMVLCNSLSGWNINRLGVIANNIQEVHCLVFATLFERWNFFEDFSVYQLIGLFSCFTNISISNNDRLITPNISGDIFLESKIQEMQKLYNNYCDYEINKGIESGISYDIHFDIINESIAWSKINNETEGTSILTKLNFEKGIFTGDFIKALFKINNISNEFEKICELTNNIQLLQKLREIPTLTLKYIATNQSLYL